AARDVVHLRRVVLHELARGLAAVTGGREDAGDERRRRARAADDLPAAVARVVDREAGLRIADGRDVGGRLVRAAAVRLIGRLRHRQAARPAALAPRGLRPAARAAVLDEPRAADRDRVRRRRRIVRALARVVVAVVAGRHEDADAGVIEVDLFTRERLSRRLRAAPAIADDGRAE